MKLRNKKTGEIIEVESLDVDSPTKGIVGIPSFDRKGSYSSLAELNAEWEDAPQEPREKALYWAIMILENFEPDDKLVDSRDYRQMLEKLKAWKRLNDVGCCFDGWNVLTAGREGDHLIIHLHIKDSTDCEKYLDLLFGGEK